jgi:hypothetical protein
MVSSTLTSPGGGMEGLSSLMRISTWARAGYRINGDTRPRPQAPSGAPPRGCTVAASYPHRRTVLDEILTLLRNVQGRIDGQIRDFARGKIVVVGDDSGPIVSNLAYEQMLHSQRLEIKEAINLLIAVAAARNALADP